jgi:hypothetical protein
MPSNSDLLSLFEAVLPRVRGLVSASSEQIVSEPTNVTPPFVPVPRGYRAVWDPSANGGHGAEIFVPSDTPLDSRLSPRMDEIPRLNIINPPAECAQEETQMPRVGERRFLKDA